MTDNKYIDAFKRMLTMALALIMVLGSVVPIATQEASAFDGKKGSKYTVYDGGQIVYGSGNGGYSNSRKCDLGDDLGSRYSYCVQPSKSSPGTGTVTVDKVITDDNDTGKWNALRNIVYYSPSYPGYDNNVTNIRSKYYTGNFNKDWGMKILTTDSELALNNAPVLGESSQNKGTRKLLLPEKSETNLEVIRYLTGRGIDREILKECIDEGLLYESLPYHNCIFVGYDESGKAAYACYRATTGERIIGDAAGSDKQYAFRINSAGSTLHVFESAIDLLSYATTTKMRTGEWRAEPMLSLGGVYAPRINSRKSKLPIALEKATQNQAQINTIALHLDNDFAGRNATKTITDQLGDRFIIRDEPPLYGKDCNDYLQHMIRQRCSRQMGRE